jgi:hypothetical protein
MRVSISSPKRVVGQFEFKRPLCTGSAGALARIEREARTHFLFEGTLWTRRAGEGARVPSNK